MNPRQFSILGFVAAFLALASTPILDAFGILVLGPGLVLAVLTPLSFAVVGVVCGLQVRATGDTEWGTRIVLSALAAFLLGAVWGVTSVVRVSTPTRGRSTSSSANLRFSLEPVISREMTRFRESETQDSRDIPPSSEDIDRFRKI